jgi:hypothetical protein
MYAYHSASRARKSQNHRADTRRLPYGVYLCGDGSAVLFDRRYQPLFRIDSRGRVSADDPDRWVTGIVAKVWWYDDSCSPRCNPETRHRVSVLLQRWQAAAAGMPVALDQLLPATAWIFNRKPPLAA